MRTFVARVREPRDVRWLHRELSEAFVSFHDGVTAERLAMVVWELVMNVVTHTEVDESAAVRVDVTATSAIVRLPGPDFDSVARASEVDARGLDTCAGRLEESAWEWSHGYDGSVNVILLQRGRNR